MSRDEPLRDKVVQINRADEAQLNTNSRLQHEAGAERTCDVEMVRLQTVRRSTLRPFLDCDTDIP